MPFVSKCTNELTAAVSQHVESGLPFRDACALAGVSRQAGYAWLSSAESDPKKYPHYVAFAESLSVARAKFKSTCLVDIRAGAPAWQSRAWLLERLFPEDFSMDRRLLRAVAKQVDEMTCSKNEKKRGSQDVPLGSEGDPDGLDDDAIGELEMYPEKD